METVHISYRASLNYHRVNKVFGLWIKGTLDLNISKDDFIKMIKEINEGG